MTPARTAAPASVAWLLALLWAGMPLYPSFIALLPIAPPGISLLGPTPALILLGAVGVLTALVARELWRCAGPQLFNERLVRAMGVYVLSWAIPSVLGFVPIVGIVFCAITVCTCVGATAVRQWGSEARVKRFMTTALLLSNALSVLTALGCWLLRTPASLYAVGNGRAIGSFVVPGELAGYLGMLLPYATGVAITEQHRLLRIAAAVTAALDAACVLATFSRAGLVGLALATALTVAVLRPRFIPWILGIAAVAATQLHHVVNLHHNPAENFNRFSIWQAALRSIVLFPLWGVGPGGFARVYPFVKLPEGEPAAFHAHSFFLTTWAETGLIGVMGLAYLWWTFIRLFRERYRTADATARLAGTAIVVGFIATWLQSMVDVVQVLFLGLWIPFMGMALVALEERPT